MLKSMEVRNLVGLLSYLRQFGRVYQGWFVWNSVGGLFHRQASRQSVKALVVSVPLLPQGAKPNSLSAGCGCVSPVCMIQPVFCYVFFPGISLLFLLLTLLRLGCKSTFLSPGFCVQKPRQYNMISCEFDLFSGFFLSWFIVSEDGVTGCGWCLAGGKGCWLKGMHQILSVN